MRKAADVDAETLAVIVDIVTELTGRKDVDPDEDFRALGGDSLRAVKVVGRIAVEFGTPDETNERILEALLDGAGASTLARLVAAPAADMMVAGSRPGSDGEFPPNALSYGEERLWLAQRYHPDTAAYHVVNAFRVAGDLDLAALDRAVHALAARHPTLCTRYDSEAPRLAADRTADPCADIAHRDGILAWPDALSLARADAVAPFDLGEGRLLRVRSYATAEAERLLVIMVHHIATDGWSMDLIYRDLTDLFAGRPCRAVSAEYREFARWERLAAEPLAGADAFAARLGRLPDRIELGHRRQRPPVRSMAGAVLRSRLPGTTADRLWALARESGSSFYVVLLAAFYLCLARRTRQWDLLVGSVQAARSQPRYHDTVGFFASTLPIRVTAYPDMTVAELLARLGEEWRWVLAHQDVPLEKIAIRARHSPDRAHGPIVDAVLVFQNNDGVRPEFVGCSVAPVPLHTGTAKFDLMLEVTPVSGTGDLDLSWEYATDVLTGEDAAELAGSFALVAGALAGRNGTVRSVTSVSAAERERGTVVSAAAREGPDTDVSMLFERLAVTGPACPAVLEGAAVVDRTGLRMMRDRLAGCLAARAVRAGDVVAIHLPRSARSVAALLAVWWIGAVPVFIDIHHPAEHRDDLVRACRPTAVITRDDAGWPPGTPVVSWDDAQRAGPRRGSAVRRGPQDPAWLVATSGSTGEPKITVGTYRGLRNRCTWALQAFPYEESEVAALRTPLGFVDAIAEAVVPLLAGVPLAVVPDRPVWDVRDLVDVLSRHRVTRLLGTPSMLRRLLDLVPDLASAAPALRWCACSGEELDPDLLTRLRNALPRRRLINLYGSSEVAGDATAAEVTDLPDGEPVPIGLPLANTGVLVVDADGEQVPPGTVGELVVTGAPVGLGYLMDGRITAVGGFRAVPGGDRGYWTGDLGWIAPGGLLYFVGRRDRQVKIKGCRVELGMVETAMLHLAGVLEAAAWGHRGGDGTERVYAAAVPIPGRALTGAGLRAQLRDRLPGYMVPARITVMDTLPLNANGKLDRAEVARLSRTRDADAPEMPGLPSAQRYLRQVWSTVLDGELAGPDEDFFALGGDSLAANTMLALLMRDTGVSLELGDFLADPTIRALASRLRGVPVPGGDRERAG